MRMFPAPWDVWGCATASGRRHRVLRSVITGSSCEVSLAQSKIARDAYALAPVASPWESQLHLLLKSVIVIALPDTVTLLT